MEMCHPHCQCGRSTDVGEKQSGRERALSDADGLTGSNMMPITG
jgi:hypothetical protein